MADYIDHDTLDSLLTVSVELANQHQRLVRLAEDVTALAAEAKLAFVYANVLAQTNGSDEEGLAAVRAFFDATMALLGRVLEPEEASAPEPDPDQRTLDEEPGFVVTDGETVKEMTAPEFLAFVFAGSHSNKNN